jgi:DMSO/TMAO reductase YedYZ molybdopterin-dependent catalytic subunit
MRKPRSRSNTNGRDRRRLVASVRRIDVVCFPRIQGSSPRGRRPGSRTAGPVRDRRLSRPLGRTPHTPLEEWTFTIRGAVDQPASWTWEEVQALPSETVTVDIHCVTKWSKLDTTWTGVSVDTLLEGVETAGEYVLAFSDGGYRPTCRSRTWSAGRPGSPTPTRASPSIQSTADRRDCSCPTSTSGRAPNGYVASNCSRRINPGFWEGYGYHNYGDPWREQRYAGD